MLERDATKLAIMFWAVALGTLASVAGMSFLVDGIHTTIAASLLWISALTIVVVHLILRKNNFRKTFSTLLDSWRMRQRVQTLSLAKLEEFKLKDCVICLDELAAASGSKIHCEVLQLPCGHEFHHACAGRWLRVQLACPICKRSLHSWRSCKLFSTAGIGDVRPSDAERNDGSDQPDEQIEGPSQEAC